MLSGTAEAKIVADGGHSNAYPYSALRFVSQRGSHLGLGILTLNRKTIGKTIYVEPG